MSLFDLLLTVSMIASLVVLLSKLVINILKLGSISFFALIKLLNTTLEDRLESFLSTVFI